MSFEDAALIASVKNLWKSYGGIPVLKGVDIDVHAGEIHALVGGNGAGKSTLMKCITGVADPDDGSIRIGEREVKSLSPREAHINSVYMVPQEPQLFPNLSVLENVTLALNDKSITRERVEEIVTSLGHPIDLDVKMHELSISNQQLIEIVRGILRNAKLLIVDEPTAALTAREVDQLFAQLRQLAESGVGIFYVSHRMSEIFELCDRVTVLRDGQMVLQAKTQDVTPSELVAAMVPNSEIVAARGARRGKTATDTPVLEVEDFTGQGFEHISFEVSPGEVLGIAGVMGSGRTELAETIYGLRPGVGTVRVKGKEYGHRSPRASLRHGLSYVPEDRHAHGVFLLGSIVDNTTCTVLPKVSSGGLIQHGKEMTITDQLSLDLALQPGSSDRRAANLAGGNQQKVSLAKALAPNPDVLILDEPSRGVDVGARSDLYRMIDRLALNGLAVVLISSDFEEIVELSDRVLVMRDGHIEEEISADEISLPAVRDAAFGTQSGQAA